MMKLLFCPALTPIRGIGITSPYCFFSYKNFILAVLVINLGKCDFCFCINTERSLYGIFSAVGHIDYVADLD